MNTCKDSKCDNEVTGKALFCSGACRTRTSRIPSVTDASVTKPSVTSDSAAAQGMERMGFTKCEVKPSATSEAQQGATIAAIEELESGQGITSGNVDEFLKDSGIITRPPCTPEQLTSSCLACVDKPTCSYLHNMNSAVPGDAKYAGVI